MSDNAEEALLWIRNKLGLQPDAQMFSGEDTIAGKLHVVCAHADSYVRWSRERDAEVKLWREEQRALRAELDGYHNREAECCPEDMGFEEYIKSLKSTVDSIAAILGWGNTPPRRVLEEEVKILRDKRRPTMGRALSDDMKQLMADASYMTGSIAADESQTPQMKERAERAWQTIKRINRFANL